MSTKKIPMRMCTACREMRPKRELVRIVKTSEGEIKFDATGKLNGRGAYICRSLDCLQKAQKTKALSRAFSCEVPTEIFETLQKDFENIEQ